MRGGGKPGVNTNHKKYDLVTMASSFLLSQSERDYIRDGCRDNCRVDGRTRTDFRSYCNTIVTGSGGGAAAGQKAKNDDGGGGATAAAAAVCSSPLILSNGSARLIGDGNVHMLCSVKAEIVSPSLDKPNQGVVEFHVDQLGNSSSSRTTRDQLEALGTALLAEHWVNGQALCVLPGQYVWKLNIDLFLLMNGGSSGSSNASGGNGGILLDAASHVIRAALQDTLLPSVTTTESNQDTPSSENNNNQQHLLLVDGDATSGFNPAGTDKSPIVITVTVLQCTDPVSRMPQYVPILDATVEEEICSYAQVHVAVSIPPTAKEEEEAAAEVCAIQTSGQGSLPLSLLPTLSSMAIEAAGKAKEAYRIAAQNMKNTDQNTILQETFAIQ